MSDDKKHFSTRDLGLAATLVSSGFPVVMIEFQYEGTKNLPVGYFFFEDAAELRETEGDYWSGRCTVEPREFQTNMRSLKSRVTDRYKSPAHNR